MPNDEDLLHAQMGTKALNLWRAAKPERNIDLQEASLPIAQLKDANLSNVDFTDADLSAADLRGANLNGAILTGACLDGSSLENASLKKADLSFASLRESRLCGADFTEAILSHATLVGSLMINDDIDSANLTGADLHRVILSKPEDKNLTGSFMQFATAKGLEKATFGREVINYLKEILEYAKRKNIHEESEPNILSCAIENAKRIISKYQ